METVTYTLGHPGPAQNGGCEVRTYTCDGCGATYTGPDCGHVDQPTPVAPDPERGGRCFCLECDS